MAFDYYSCFKISRVRDALKDSGFKFTAMEKLYLVYNCNKTYREKLSAYEEIIRENGYIVITEYDAHVSNEVYDYTLGSLLRKYIEDREKLLIKFKSSEPKSFYRLQFTDDKYNSEDSGLGQMPGYFNDLNECKSTFEKYVNLMARSIGEIQKIYINKCYYETEYSPYDDSVIYCTYNKDFELLSVDEVATGFVDYPDPDVELLKQLDFEFLTPKRSKYGMAEDNI